MNPPGVCCTASLNPLASHAPEPPSLRRLSGWWFALRPVFRRVWQHTGRFRGATAPGAHPLDVAELSAHLVRDLNLHAAEDGWLEHQRALQHYEATQVEWTQRPFL